MLKMPLLIATNPPPMARPAVPAVCATVLRLGTLGACAPSYKSGGDARLVRSYTVQMGSLSNDDGLRAWIDSEW